MSENRESDILPHFISIDKGKMAMARVVYRVAVSGFIQPQLAFQKNKIK